MLRNNAMQAASLQEEWINYATTNERRAPKTKKITTAWHILILCSGEIGATPFRHTQNAGGFSRESMLGITGAVDDASSVGAARNALYKPLTFAEGNAPDLSRFRNLFAAKAPCIRVNKDQSVDRMTLDSLILSFRERVKSGTLKNFREYEIARKTQRFGQMANVFSRYQKGLTALDPAGMFRGINRIQPSNDDGSWQIGGPMWMDERPEMSISPEYQR